MPFTPVSPTISSSTANGFTIVVNADGNPTPPATYYTFRIVTGVGSFYVNALGVLQATKIFLPLLSVTVANAVPNTLHSVSLTAADDAIGTNESGSGSVATVTTLAAAPIATSFTNIFSTTVMANWSANSNPSGTNYEVQVSPDPSFVSGIISSGFITTVGYIFNDLLPSTIYYGRVRARDSVLDLTSFISLGSFATFAGPDTVKVIRVYNLLAERGYLITWQPNQETNIFSYKVYRSESPTDFDNFQVIGTTPKIVTSFIDHVPFNFGIVFYYIVTAFDDGGNESSLLLTTPAQENTFHSFEEQPFPTSITTLDLIVDEVPQGDIDGVNMLFITAFPYRKNSVEVYLNGMKMLRGLHFNEGPLSQEITLTDPPDLGGYLRINYKRFGI